MKKLTKIGQSKILTGLLILMLYSCSEKKWDEYYAKPEYLKGGSIMNFLAMTPDYKEFSGLLMKTGYDSLLKRSEAFTVFAPKNGSFSGIDTTSDIVALKKMMGMHILPSAIFKENMSNNYYLSLSGKPLKFADTPGGETVNKIKISSFDKRVFNGVVHEIANVIMPFPNINDFVRSDPDFLRLKDLYSTRVIRVFLDVAKNTVIGYDTSKQTGI